MGGILFRSPMMVMLMAFLGFYFLMSIMPILVILLVVILWTLFITWFLYKNQLLPEKIMDLLDQFTNKEAFQRELNEMRKKLTVVDAEAMAKHLNSRVIDQERVIGQISKTISRRVARKRKNKPIFTVLLSGPTGTGKTELAKATTEFLFKNEDAMMRIDVGTLDPNHGVSSLVGVPKGYQGQDSWGTLTKFIKTRPESMILFDELEKAGKNPDAPLYKVLLSLLDEGRLTEQSCQETVDASGCIVFMTSNAAHKELGEIAERYADDEENLIRASKEALQDYFAPEFLGRIDLVTTVNKLSDHGLAKICVLHLLKITKEYDLELEYIDQSLLVDFIKKSEILKNLGLRDLIRSIENMVADELIDAKQDGAKKVALNFDDGKVTVDIMEV